MRSMYYEDFKTGQRFTTSARTVTETDLVDFMRLTGLHSPLFTDDEFAKKSGHKGKIIPGPLTFSLSMGLFTKLGLFDESIIAFLGMDRMRLFEPVRPGDTIRVEVEIAESRGTKKPDRGVIREEYRVLNQRDETVMTYEMAHLVKRR